VLDISSGKRFVRRLDVPVCAFADAKRNPSTSIL
jgi:hypothetical protein